jgi:hypothetical protein
LEDGSYSMKKAMESAKVHGFAYKSPNIEKLMTVIGAGRTVDTPLGKKQIHISAGKLVISTHEEKRKSVGELIEFTRSKK